MKKHKLLEKAMRDYPAGTSFKSLYHGTECVSTGIFYISDGVFSDAAALRCDINGVGRALYCFVRDEWAEIIPDKPKSILKVAVRIENEREFELVKDWKFKKSIKTRGDYDSMCYMYPEDKGVFFIYLDNDAYDSEDVAIDKGYNIIPFESFAAEVGMKAPVFVMQSEDGVDLYEGDDYHRAWYEKEKSKWFYDSCTNLNSMHAVCRTDDNAKQAKAFSTREAAEKWIEEQNRPKSVTIPLFKHKECKSAEITTKKITIRDGGDIYYLKPSDIEDVMHALQGLKQEGGSNA